MSGRCFFVFHAVFQIACAAFLTWAPPVALVWQVLGAVGFFVAGGSVVAAIRSAP